MAGKVFLNYRRGDDPGFVQALYLRLEEELGRDALFMDVEGHIKGGDDFVDVLRAQVEACDVLLAVIGPRWLNALDEQGRRRLDNPEDWVRIEMVGALETGKRVIPVLVGGAEIPRADDLPEALKPLARRQAIRITLERFRSDTAGLVSQVKAVLGNIEMARAAATEVERQAASDAEARRQAEEAARVAERERQEAEQARQQRVAGMSPDAIREALEVENWAFVKDKNDPAELRDHIARFAGGPTERFAAEKLASLVWVGLGTKPDKAKLQSFLDEFPKAREAASARSALGLIEAEEDEARREQQAWDAAVKSTDKTAIEVFLREWPKSVFAGDARERLKELRATAGYSRRAILKGVGYGVGGSVAAGGLGIATFEPGMPIWRILNDRSIRTHSGHVAGVLSVAFAPDGGMFVSGSADTSARLWDVSSGEEVRRFLDLEGSITAVATAPDGRTAVTGNSVGTIRFWDVATAKEVHSVHQGKPIAAIVFTPDGRFVLVGSSDETLRLRDVASGNEVRSFSDHSNWVAAVAMSPDGRRALSGSWDGTMKLWDVGSGKLLRTFIGHKTTVSCVAFRADGRTVLSGSWDNSVKMWDVNSGNELRTFAGHTNWINGLAVAPNDRYVVSGSNDHSLRQWDLATGDFRTFTGHTDVVTSVALAPDGRRAVSGSADGTLKLWDVAV